MQSTVWTLVRPNNCQKSVNMQRAVHKDIVLTGNTDTGRLEKLFHTPCIRKITFLLFGLVCLT